MKDYEKPIFDCNCWSANTRHGMVWSIFPKNDPRSTNKNGFEEARKAVDKIIETGQPLFGGWR